MEINTPAISSSRLIFLLLMMRGWHQSNDERMVYELRNCWELQRGLARPNNILLHPHNKGCVCNRKRSTRTTERWNVILGVCFDWEVGMLLNHVVTPSEDVMEKF